MAQAISVTLFERHTTRMGALSRVTSPDWTGQLLFPEEPFEPPQADVRRQAHAISADNIMQNNLRRIATAPFRDNSLIYIINTFADKVNKACVNS